MGGQAFIGITAFAFPDKVQAFKLKRLYRPDLFRGKLAAYLDKSLVPGEPVF